jgi:hypothetical protein
MPRSVGFFAKTGSKYINGVPIPLYNPYNSTNLQEIFMEINLKENQGFIRFLVNGFLSAERAFGGLNEWNDIYFGFSLFDKNSQAKFIYFREE